MIFVRCPLAEKIQNVQLGLYCTVDQNSIRTATFRVDSNTKLIRHPFGSFECEIYGTKGTIALL
jgi:hypothetical protein